MTSSGLTKFTIAVKRLIDKTPDKGRSFRRAVGKAFSNVGSNNYDRDIDLASRLTEVTGYIVRTPLSGVIHSCHMRGVGNLDTATALFYLTIIDETYSLHAETIKTALCGRRKNFEEILGWCPQRQNPAPLPSIVQVDQPPPSPKLRLRLPGIRSHPSHYSNHTIDIIGRASERETLLRFAGTEPGFRWLQLAGSGGQGKSRLALDLIIRVGKKGWEAGFLDSADLTEFQGSKGDHRPENWRSWAPAKPYLIVIDYVIGREADIGYAMDQLADRTAKFELPVCILLIERQRWDRGALAIAIDSGDPFSTIVTPVKGIAQWFMQVNYARRHDLSSSKLLFESGVIEISGLDTDNLVAIVRRLCVGSRLGYLSDIQIADLLYKVDRGGRPLFAYFLAQALYDGAFKPGWEQSDLLEYVFTDHCRKSWNRSWGPCPRLDQDHPAIRLVILATIIRFVDLQYIEKISHWLAGDSETRLQAISLAGGTTDGSIRGTGRIIPALEPDILGEWLVLAAISSNPNNYFLLKVVKAISFHSLSDFLIRAVQDFYYSDDLINILNYQSDNKDVEFDISSAKAYFVVFLRHNDIELPATINPILVYEEAARKGNAWAMALLGAHYLVGHEGLDGIENAVFWFTEAADHGYLPAMRILGALFSDGTRIESNSHHARYWYERASRQGDVTSMLMLGLIYLGGSGIETNISLGRAWLRRAAKLGGASAAFYLGMSYLNDAKTTRSLKVAAGWVQKAADSGFSEAMYYLGKFFALGWGVEVNSEKSSFWIKRAVDMGFDISDAGSLTFDRSRGEL